MAALLQDGRPHGRRSDGIMLGGGRDIAGERASSSPLRVLSLLTEPPRCSAVCAAGYATAQNDRVPTPRAAERSGTSAAWYDTALVARGPNESAQGARGVAASTKSGHYFNHTLYTCSCTVRDGAIEIGSARAVGLISEIEGEIGRSVGPISRRFL